ncbi:MAG: SixA phosphatase family protein [Gaiellaceae bacterium]
MILLVRHASAGDRYEWEDDDGLRPLDERGRRQANELVDLLEQYEVTRLFSSPALRCVQTVEPFAQARGFDIEVRDELSEERQDPDGPTFVASFHDVDAVLSCHGGLSEAICGESQKKGEVIVLDGTVIVTRLRAKGR